MSEYSHNLQVRNFSSQKRMIRLLAHTHTTSKEVASVKRTQQQQGEEEEAANILAFLATPNSSLSREGQLRNVVADPPPSSCRPLVTRGENYDPVIQLIKMERNWKSLPPCLKRKGEISQLDFDEF